MTVSVDSAPHERMMDMSVVKLADLIKAAIKFTGTLKGEIFLSDDIKRPKRYIKNLESKWLLRHPDKEFRIGNGKLSKRSLVVPTADMWIVLGILIAAVGNPPTEKKDDFGSPVIRDWLAGKLDRELRTNPYMVEKLWEHLAPIIRFAYAQGKADEPTAQEWLDVLSSMLGYPVAHYEIQLREILEDFKDLAPAIDMSSCGPGRIVVEDEHGHRAFTRHHIKEEIDIEGKTVDDIVEELSTNAASSDYLEVLVKIAKKLQDGASKKAADQISRLVKMGSLMGDISPEFKRLRDMLGDDYERRVGTDDDGNPIMEKVEVEPTSMANGNLVYYQHVHDYLERHPDILEDMAEKYGATSEKVLHWLDCRAEDDLNEDEK